jgi:hypothetical protein
MSNVILDQLADRVRDVLNSDTEDAPEVHDSRQQATFATVMARTGNSTARGSEVGTHVSWHRPRVFGLAAAAIAVVAMIPIAFTILSPTTSSAVTFLNHAIAVTNTQPPIPSLVAGQYYYESVHETGISACRVVTLPNGSRELYAGTTNGQPFLVYVESWDQERWTTANGSGGVRDTNGTGHFINSAQQSQWVADGSPSLGNCAGPLTTSTLSPTTTSPRDGTGLLALPTSPSALGSLIAQGRVNPYGVVSPTNVMCPTTARGGAPSPDANGHCSTAEQFDIASALLQQAEGPQLVGPALFQILAQLPGVSDVGSVTDAEGRVGVGIEYTDADHSTMFVIDPTSGQLLEEQSLASNSAFATGGISAGDVTSTITFGTLSVVNRLGDTPSS